MGHKLKQRDGLYNLWGIDGGIMSEQKNDLICIINRLLGKVTSARFLATVMVIATLCLSVDKCLDMSMQAAQNERVFSLIKDIIMLLLGAFVSTATAIVTLYFSRTDRAAIMEDNDNGSVIPPEKK
jgi:hypothetical protein